MPNWFNAALRGFQADAVSFRICDDASNAPRARARGLATNPERRKYIGATPPLSASMVRQAIVHVYGIQQRGVCYYHPDLRRIIGERVSVKSIATDPRAIWVKLGGKYVRLTSPHDKNRSTGLSAYIRLNHYYFQTQEHRFERERFVPYSTVIRPPQRQAATQD